MLLDADAIEERKIAPGLTRTLYLFLGFLLFAVLWSIFSEIDEVISAKGRLVSLEPTVVLQPYDTSIVKSLNVQVGQVVAKDELLAALDPTFVGADYNTEKDRLASLTAQVERYEAELSGKPSIANPSLSVHTQIQSGIIKDRLDAYNSKLRTAELSMAKARTTLELAEHSVRNLTAKLTSSIEMERMTNQLFEGGFVSKRTYLESVERKLDVEKELISAQNQRSEASTLAKSLQQELQIFKREYSQKLQEELVTVKRERDALSQSLKKVDLRNGLLEIRSPIDGVVLEVANRSVGSIVTGAAPFITLAPVASKLNAHIFVQPSDINQIKVGDQVKVKIDAYPFQRFGILNGRILRITRDVVRPDFRGVSEATDYYVVVIDLDVDKNQQLLKSMRLLSGMTLTGEVLIGERSIFSYVTAPIVKIKEESLNEKK